MSKNGKLKKAKNVEKRRHQMEEALECLPIKLAAEYEPSPVLRAEQEHPAEEQKPIVLRREPKQCSFEPCGRYLDPSCTVCPYCGHPLSS